MLKDIIKLVIAFWIIKTFLIDNELLEKVGCTIKEKINNFLK
jgi:hypothetical protein